SVAVHLDRADAEPRARVDIDYERVAILSFEPRPGGERRMPIALVVEDGREELNQLGHPGERRRRSKPRGGTVAEKPLRDSHVAFEFQMSNRTHWQELVAQRNAAGHRVGRDDDIVEAAKAGEWDDALVNVGDRQGGARTRRDP